MDLEDSLKFPSIDKQNMLAEIEGLPGQLTEAWQLGKEFELPHVENMRTIVLAGMGGSAIGGDLFSAYCENFCKLQIYVHRNYDLPRWVRGDDCLVITSSHSGNTEEVLSAFNTAIERKCHIVAITTGGKLAEKAKSAKVPLWQFKHEGQPRAAVGYSFGLLLSLGFQMGIISDPSPEINATVEIMKEQQACLRAEIPVRSNPAKRLAGQMAGRIVSVYGADFLSPVARRWKTQLNELAKAWSQYDYLPEANHNAIAGTLNPAGEMNKMLAVFLFGSLQLPRNRERLKLHRESYMLEGINTDAYEAQGDTRLAQMWTSIHFGDYLSYYLAMLYDADPTAIETITWLKKALK